VAPLQVHSLPPLKKGVGGIFRMLQYDKKLKPFSQKLRTTMTDAEILLWSRIKGKQLKGMQFYRQKIIGRYIADFYCAAAKLVIEVDGGQHYTNDGRTRDAIRDTYMNSLGLKVVRFSDTDVLKNIDGVVEHIFLFINPPTPFAKGGVKRACLEFPF
jgi:very-short-patch-repair endonuclease